jgi:hypothetical protein
VEVTMSDANGKGINPYASWDHTFTWGPARITVRRKTVGTNVLIAQLYSKMPREADAYQKELLARIVAQSIAIDGLDLALPQVTADEAAWTEAYERFLAMDGNLVEAWDQALRTVDRPPGPKEFWPPGKLTDAEKNGSGSGETSDRTPSAAGSRTSPAKTRNPAT